MRFTRAAPRQQSNMNIKKKKKKTKKKKRDMLEPTKRFRQLNHFLALEWKDNQNSFDPFHYYTLMLINNKKNVI